jgi:hypothetical protein
MFSTVIFPFPPWKEDITEKRIGSGTGILLLRSSIFSLDPQKNLHLLTSFTLSNLESFNLVSIEEIQTP